MDAEFRNLIYAPPPLYPANTATGIGALRPGFKSLATYSPLIGGIFDLGGTAGDASKGDTRQEKQPKEKK